MSRRFHISIGAFFLLIRCTYQISSNFSELFPFIETYRLDKFPTGKVALHMPCLESNMFATNCACHIFCTEPRCKRAYQVCEKYRLSKGCKYVLLRGNPNRIATLKRTATAEELKKFSIEKYPTSLADVGFGEDGSYSNSSSSYWHTLNARLGGGKNGKILSDLVAVGGKLASDTLVSLYSEDSPKGLCGISKMPVAPVTIATREGQESVSLSLFPVRNQTDFLSQGIALVCLNYRTPMTLVNTLSTWSASGLLLLMSQRLMMLNDPYPSEIAMALEHGFEILQPKDIPNSKIRKPNVLTIGAAFYYALSHVTCEYVLFLENDFKMDVDLLKDEIIFQLIGSAGMLNRGAEVIRLMSRKGQGCGTFKSCDHGGIHLDAENPSERLRNWYSFYCDEVADMAGVVATCMRAPNNQSRAAFRCFTSYDSNWSLNTAMVKKSTMMKKKYAGLSIADIGLQNSQRQDGFESSMNGHHRWMDWRVPICISYEGMFLHEEIETSA